MFVGKGGREARGGEAREGNECVRADAAGVRSDASVLSPGNFITDATLRPSHRRPNGHRSIVRPSVIVRVTTLLPAVGRCLGRGQTIPFF
jgi:hypothetical protein